MRGHRPRLQLFISSGNHAEWRNNHQNKNESRRIARCGLREKRAYEAEKNSTRFLKAGAGLAGRRSSGGSRARGRSPACTGHLPIFRIWSGTAASAILLRGVVLSLDPKVGDLEKGDVLIDGKTIAQVAPSISASDAEVVDCSGTIVMPGFITTHHHQYETLQRSIIPDGLLAGAWPLESYGSVVQNIWTVGRIVDPAIRTTSFGTWGAV